MYLSNNVLQLKEQVKTKSANAIKNAKESNTNLCNIGTTIKRMHIYIQSLAYSPLNLLFLG